MQAVLKGGTLIDRTGTAPAPQAVVVIEGDRVTCVGTEPGFGSALTGAVDVAGKTVLPGLIHGHEYLVNRWGAGTDVIGDLATEMTLMMQGGMTAMQVLQSAKRVNAEILGQAAGIGTVEPGKLADVCVVGGDPLADIGVVRDVRMVFRGGRLHRSEVLARATGKIPL